MFRNLHHLVTATILAVGIIGAAFAFFRELGPAVEAFKVLPKVDPAAVERARLTAMSPSGH